ncbi:ParM/StbA family protein [Heliorestis convoluta]|uniref:ParM/StbA family protein n=1 Tax=Heliorestis convoluta TaxID=356322 RepID=A0A5Q2MWT8_9FIRM|nr:ParM/StbA family protein [Heliorestis convoluta]QGG46867.1 ParM/StbA family protein [Heliorestis convoluta]
MFKIGIDLGYGYTKGINQEGRTIIFPSIIGAAHDRMTELFGQDTGTLEALHVQIKDKNNDSEHFVGDLARKESLSSSFTLERNKISNDNTKVLLSTSLAMLVPSQTVSLHVVTGLPFEHYLDQRKTFEEAYKGYQSEVYFHGGPLKDSRRQIRIDRLTIFPQAAGAAYSLLQTAEGKMRYPELFVRGSIIAVVDVGFKTTDYVVFEMTPSLSLRRDLSGTINIGISSLYRPLQILFNKRTGGQIDMNEVEILLQTGTIFFAGQERDFREDIKRIKEAVAKEIRNKVLASWGSKADLIRMVFLVGGGSRELGEDLKTIHPLAKISDDPQMANARGFLSVAKMTELAEKKTGSA